MTEYLKVDKSFLFLIVPLCLLLLGIGGASYQLSSIGDRVEKIDERQTEYLLTQHKVEELICDVEELEGIVDGLRFKDMKNMKVWFDEDTLTPGGIGWLTAP